MNVDLLMRVKKHILQKPTRLRMSNWLVSKDLVCFVQISKKGRKYFDFGATDDWNEPQVQPIPECGTVGCIAGWTCLLSGKSSTTQISYDAMNLLQINHTQKNLLFFVSHWPDKFQSPYKKAKNSRERAKIVGEVIDAFIKTNGTFHGYWPVGHYMEDFPEGEYCG